MLKRLIEIETAEIGTRETGQNYCKYNDWYWGPGTGGPDYPWCVVFQAWAADRAGVPFPKTAHCDGVRSYARERGQWVTGDYKPGDFVVFDYDGNGSGDHIGLVISASGKRLVTIEGNTADQVASRTYTMPASISGAYRPEYDTSSEAEPAPDPEAEQDPGAGTVVDCGLPVLTSGDFGEAVGSLQTLLRFHGYRLSGSFTRSGAPDQEFGPETEAALLDLTGRRETDVTAWKILIGGLG